MVLADDSIVALGFGGLLVESFKVIGDDSGVVVDVDNAKVDDFGKVTELDDSEAIDFGVSIEVLSLIHI